MFNEKFWTVECYNCHEEMVYLRIYMETVNGHNELLLETFSKCPHCNGRNES